MNNRKLELQKYDEELDFFKINFKKSIHIQESLHEKEKGNIFRSAIFALLFPPLAVTAFILGITIADKIWQNIHQPIEKSVENKRLNNAEIYIKMVTEHNKTTN